MHTLTIPIANICPNKLHSELGDLGIQYALLHNDENVVLQFNGVTETVTLDENQQPVEVCTYTKTQIVIENIDGVDVVTQVEVDCTSEMEGIINTINTCVANHDPTPIAPAKTQLELLDEDIQRNYEMMLTIGGIW